MLKSTIQRSIVTTVGFLLLLTLFTAITACSGSQQSSSSQQSSVNNSNNQNGGETNKDVNTEDRDFTLSGNTPPTLVAKNDVGSVNVLPGSNGNTVHVKVVKSGGNPDDIQVNYSQSGNTVTVTINRTKKDSNTIADADITLPAKSNLQVENGAGTVTVNGIEGRMLLSNKAGNINATQVKLANNSQLQANVGNIEFSGSLDQGNFLFQASTGSIDVQLPGNANFSIDAKTNVGQISSDFSNVTIQQVNTIGASASGNVGSAPFASITLSTDTGSIDLKQG